MSSRGWTDASPFGVSLSINGYIIHPFCNLKVCLGDILLELRHHYDIEFGFYVISSSAFVWAHHFYNDKNHCVPIILSVESIGCLKDPQLALRVCGRWVSYPQDQHLGSYVMLVNYFLLGSVILWWSIVCCGVTPQTYSWVVLLQVFTVWVRDSLSNGRLGRNFPL